MQPSPIAGSRRPPELGSRRAAAAAAEVVDRAFEWTMTVRTSRPARLFPRPLVGVQLASRDAHAGPKAAIAKSWAGGHLPGTGHHREPEARQQAADARAVSECVAATSGMPTLHMELGTISLLRAQVSQVMPWS